MAQERKITYTASFKVDKSGLQQMEAALQSVYLKADSMANTGQKMSDGLKVAGQTAKDLEKILQSAYNPKLGTMNITKFNQSLKETGYTAASLKQNLSYDTNGAYAFNQLSRSILNTNTQLVQSNKLLDKMGETLGNTIRWSITSSLINTITSSIQKAYTYTKQLDTSLNNIRIVTGKSAEEMNEFAESANKAAKALGTSTLDYSKASLIYYQQGLSDQEVQARAETTVKVANITKQTGDAVSEELTAVWNGYKVSAQETEKYIDKLAAVAATTASDLEELSIGMSKVASAANAMGVDFDDLNAQIATIVSVTRQAPESVGTALKTIYARMGDLKVDGVDEFGVKLGEVTSQLQTMGIEILDQNGNMRDMSSVMAEVAEKWNTWTRAQQQAAAIAMAGKRQYNNLVALFENWDMYSEALETSKDSLGTLQKQQDIYMESTEAKLKTLKATWEGLYKNLFNQEDIKSGVDGLINIIDLSDKVIKNFGGGIKTLTAFGTILTSIFSQQLGQSINGFIQQQNTLKYNLELLNKQKEFLAAGSASGKNDASSTIEEKEKIATKAALDEQIDKTKQIISVKSGLSKEEAEILMNLQKQAGELKHNITYAQEQAEAVLKSNEALEKQTVLLGGENFSVKEAVDQEWGLYEIFEKTYEDQQLKEDTIQELKKENLNLEKEITKEIDKQINKIDEKLPKLKEEAQLEAEKNSVKQQKITSIFDNNIKTLEGYQSKDLRQNTKEGRGVKTDFDSISKDLKQSLSKEGQEKFDSIITSSESFAKILQKIINLLREEKALQLENEKANNNRAKIELDNANKEKANLEEKKALKQETLADNKEEIATLQEEVKYTNDLITSTQKYAQVTKEQKENQKELNALNLEFNQKIAAAKSGANIVNTITGISSAFSTLAMSINSVNTLIDVWADKEKNFGDKMLQTTMSLGIAIPMLISSYDKFNAALGVNITLSDLFTISKEKNIAAQEVENAKIKEQIAIDNIRRRSKNSDLILDGQKIATEIAKAKSIDEVTKADVRRIVMQRTKGKYNRQEKIDLYELTLEELNLKNATDAHTASIEKQKIAMASSGWGIALLAIAAVATGIMAVVKANKKWHEQRQEDLKEDLDEIKNKQQIIKENYELIKSYNDLFIQYQKTGESKEDLYNKTLELVDVYNIEGGRILALAGDYETAYKRINKARRSEIIANIENTEKGVKDTAQLMGEAGNNGTGKFKNNKYSFSYTTDTAMTQEWDFASKAFDYAGMQNDYSKLGNGQVIFGTEIDLNDKNGPQQLLEWANRLDKALDYYEHNASEHTRKVSPVYKELKEEASQFTDELKEDLRNQIQLLNDQKMALDFIDFDFDKIQSDAVNQKDLINKTYNEINEIRQKYINSFSRKELNEKIQENLDSLNIDEDVQLKIQLMFEIADKTEKQLEEDEINLISNLNTQQLVYLEAHLDTALLSEDLKDWIEDNNEILSFMGSKGNQQAYSNLLSNYNEKEGFDSSSIDSIYTANTEIGGLNQDQFNSLDNAEQLNTMTIAYINQTKAIVEQKDAILEKLNAERNAIEITEEDKKKQEQYDRGLNNIVKSSDKLKGKTNELKDIFAQLSDGEENLTDEQQLLLDDFRAQAKEVGRNSDAYEKYYLKAAKTQDLYEYLTNQINQITDAELDHALVLEKTQQIQNLNNSILDDAQSAYKSLDSMVQEYNETHSWTLDNIQSLMTMSDKYVAQLNFENGQLSLNEEGFKALTIAKLEDELATAELQYQAEMNKLATIAEADANDYAAQKAALYSAQLEALGSVAEGTTAKMWDLANAIAAIDQKGSPEVQAAAEQATKAYENRKKAIEEGIKQIRSGSGFGSMMGASSKSSGGSKSKEESKKFEDEFDRYWEYKKAIDLLDKSLSRLEKQQSKLHGKELIESLKKENELLEQQKANYDALFEAQKREAGELKGQLEYYGAAFKDNGELTNYADVTTQMLAQYTSAIQQYNAGALDEAGLKLYEAQYEDFKKALERYDTLYYSEMQDTMDKLDDARRKQLENNLKAWETEIQIKLDLTEAKRNWNNFVRDIEQDFRKIYSDLTIESLFDTKNFKEYNEDLNTTLQAIHDVENEIDKLSATGKSDMFQSMSEAQEKLKDLGDELIENGKNLYELYENIWDNYIDKLDQAADNLKDINEEFEHITTELEYEKKLIELIYGDKAYAKMDKFYTTQQKNINTQLNSLKAQRDFWEQQFNAAYEMNKVNHNVILNDMSTWTEDMRKAYDEMIDSQEKLNDMIIDGINNLTDKYLNKLAETFDKLEKATWGMSLDDLKDDWDRITNLADEYLDAAEGFPQIQMLINKVNQGIDDTKDLKLQQKLAEFRDNEVQALMDKKDLTEDDLKLMEARYNIMLKEAALEDAQNAKNSMKLTRNSSGNWTYQYVADDTDVAEKQNDLLQSYQDLYKMADDAYQHAMELAMSSYETMQEKIKEIAEDTTITEEEKMMKIQEIQDTYLPMIQAAAENSELYRQEAIAATGMIFTEVCEQNEDAYEHLTDEQKILVDATKENHLNDYEAIREAVVDNTYPAIQEAATTAFEQTNLNSSTVAADIIGQWAGDDGESVKNKLNEAIDDIEKNTQDFEDELDNMRDIADVDFTDIDTMIDTTTGKIEEMGNKTEDMVNRSTPQLELMRQYVNDIEVAFGDVIERVFEAISAMAEYTEATAAAVEEMNNLIIASRQYNGPAIGVTGATGGAGGSGNQSERKYSTIANGKKYKWQADPYGNSDTMGLIDSEGNYVAITTDDSFSKNIADIEKINDSTKRNYFIGRILEGVIKNAQGFTGEDISLNDIDLSEFYKALSSYATGGYTGEWDTSGKLAILHQKELILNQDDTENFLKATSLLNNISKINGNIEDSIMTSILNMMGALAPKVSGFNMDNKSSEVGGNVFNITAEFPNANDVSSIKEAILSLPNIASQYVHQRS